MNADQTRESIACIADTIASAWFKDQCRDRFAYFYLWYRLAKPGEKISIPIHSGDPPNDEYRLASPHRLSPAWTINQCKVFIQNTMKTLPILGEE